MTQSMLGQVSKDTSDQTMANQRRVCPCLFGALLPTSSSQEIRVRHQTGRETLEQNDLRKKGFEHCQHSWREWHFSGGGTLSRFI